jgi:uncharacterized membrane protein YgcG
MTSPPQEFGKRRPAAPAPSPAPPVKRSRHVALLLMGTMAVGGGAYALMPRENCQPSGPGVAAPSSPEAGQACATRTSSSGGHGGSGGWWSRSSFYGGNSSSSGTSTSSGATETTRGGFGGFAHSIAAHFSGG